MRFIHFNEYEYINNVQYIILHTRIDIMSHVSVKAITSKLGKSGDVIQRRLLGLLKDGGCVKSY